MRWCRYGPVLVVGLVAGTLGAAPPADGPISLPKPAVVPQPLPVPGAVVKLAADQLYVVDCKVECVVRDHPKGLVRVAKKKGPRDFSAKFVDGTGGLEDRTYDGPFLYVVQAVGTGRVELDVIPVGFKSEAEIVTATVDVSAGQGPQPPPVPPKPDPTPDPAKVDSVWVIVVEDAAGPRTVETAKALNDPFWQTLRPKNDWRHYLNTSKVAVDNGYTKVAEKTGFPAVLVMDANGGGLLKSFKLTTAAAVSDAVKEVVK